MGSGIPGNIPGEPSFLFDVTTGGLGGLLLWLLNLLFLVNLALSFVYLIWGGIQIILAGGDIARGSRARNAIIYSVVGLTVSILALLIIRTFGSAGGVNLGLP